VNRRRLACALLAQIVKCAPSDSPLRGGAAADDDDDDDDDDDNGAKTTGADFWAKSPRINGPSRS
jgi:hypothetical protein